MNVSLRKPFSLGLLYVLSLGLNFLLKDSFVGQGIAVFLLGRSGEAPRVSTVVSIELVLGRSSVSSREIWLLILSILSSSLKIDSFTATLVFVYSCSKSRSFILSDVSSLSLTSGSPIVSKKSPLMIIFLGISFGTLSMSSLMSKSFLLVSPLGL